MVECDLPQTARDASRIAARDSHRGPSFLCMPSDNEKPRANERSTHAPKTWANTKAAHGPAVAAALPSRRGS